MCVQIAYDAVKNVATLDWLGTEKGGCEQEGKDIHGADTVAMVDLGITILRKLYPEVNQWIKLRDSSKFKCDLPDGNHVPISNMIYTLLLYGETYYQSRFNAIPYYEEANPGIAAFVKSWNSDPLPENIDFRNKDLTELLIPIYNSSSTWKEFFQAVYKKYNRKTCTLLHSWYLDVFGSLAKVPITTDWKFDIITRPMILFEITSKKNNRNYTRKSYIYDPYNFSGGYFPSLLEYKTYVAHSTNGRTRKNH